MSEQRTDREMEIMYKNRVVELLATTIYPWAWDEKAFSAGARAIFQENAKKKAREQLRVIAEFIIPWNIHRDWAAGITVTEVKGEMKKGDGVSAPGHPLDGGKIVATVPKAKPKKRAKK